MKKPPTRMKPHKGLFRGDAEIVSHTRTKRYFAVI